MTTLVHFMHYHEGFQHCTAKNLELHSSTYVPTYLLLKVQILLKFMYSEKATKFREISTLLLTVCTVVRTQK